MKTVDTVAFIIEKDGQILVEKRKQDKETDPGKVAIPGGHVEAGESLVQACRRELMEELEMDCDGFEYITKILHPTRTENQLNHYFICRGWRGRPQSKEADRVYWIAMKDTGSLDIKADREAMVLVNRKKEL